MARLVTIQVRIACPRLYQEKGHTTVINIEKCKACRFHDGIKDDHVICKFPAQYNKSEQRKYKPW